MTGAGAARRERHVWRILAALYLAVHTIGVAGCADVNGGAVELSWKLRPASGSLATFVNCDVNGTLSDPDPTHDPTKVGFTTGSLTAIRVSWEVGAVSSFKDFACYDGHGVTGFDLPLGNALISVSPICANGPAATNTYIAPSPVARAVQLGDAINLGAVELILDVEHCPNGNCPATPVKCVCE